jgi:virginiamycin B lyase
MHEVHKGSCFMRHHRLPFSHIILTLIAANLLILLSGCAASQSQGAVIAYTSHVPSVRYSAVQLVPAPPLSATVLTAQRHLFTFASSNVGLMQPVADKSGNIWVGEMNANSLGYLNARTGAVASWRLPRGQYGIMGTAIDAQGNIWFSEQFANYIGRFNISQKTIHMFSLGTTKGAALGPQQLQFDARGFLWFTASDGNAIGRLDPTTGAVRLWTLPASPSGMVVAPDGHVWFGYLTGGAIGSLDPTTGQIIIYQLPHSSAQIYSMSIDSAGHLWFTEASPGRLDMFDPVTNTLTELPVPSIEGRSPSLSELVIDPQGNVWFVDVGANMLVRYVPGKHAFTFYQLSLSSASPFALTLSPSGNLWFTAGNATVNYLGEMAS